MIWFVLILTMILTAVPQWWSKWGFRFYVIVSFAANVILGLLPGTRRRSASGGWAKVQVALVFILWGLYQFAETAATSAISGLTLSGSDDVSEDEKQLVALWAPFLLLHLGGPDNLTAYALEDNELSGRKWVEMAGNLFGVAYAIYKYAFRGRRSWLLLAASTVVYVAGATRYGERVYALWKANLDKMQEDGASSKSNDKKTPRETSKSCSCCSAEDAKMNELKCRIKRKLRRPNLCDEEALLIAQDLFPIWRRALFDSSVMPKSASQRTSERIVSLEWESMCKVVEMELSLMYEVLYTKAIVAYTWLGWYYLIRVLSPLCTAAAALLLWLHRRRHQQQQQQQIRGSFVRITYAMLAIDFLLDLAWLLRALGSTWAYAYLQVAPAWLRHHVLCPGRWRCLRRFVVCVDPMRWLLCRDPVSYRTWSGTIGRYNLLRECTAAATRRSQCLEWLVYWVGDWWPEETRYLSDELQQGVKELLFKRVKKILLEAIENNEDKKKKKKEDPKEYSMVHIRTQWGQKAFDQRNQRRLFPELGDDHKEAPKFGKEFEEDVLTWHIATCIFLQYVRQHKRGAARPEAHEKAVEVMSEYMMFLVAVRREMLPGLVLHSLREVTHHTLVDIWGRRTKVLSPEEQLAPVKNEEKLAMILRCIRRTKDDTTKNWEKIEGSEGTELLWDAVELFASLTLAGDTLADRKRRSKERVRRRRRVPVPELLEFIFNVWVDKLVYAAVNCSRESHAKQLSAGGDLTTVLWMVIQHAGPFRMGEQKPIYIRHHDDKPKPRRPAPPTAPTPAPTPTPQFWGTLPQFAGGWSHGGWCPLPHDGWPHGGWCPPPHDGCCPPPPQGGWCPPSQGGLCPSDPLYHPPVHSPCSCPQHEKPEDEPGMIITPTEPPTSPPDEDREDEDEYQDSDDEDTEEYNTPINYVTLY